MGNDGIRRPLLIGDKDNNVTREICLARWPTERGNALASSYLLNYCFDLLTIHAMAADLCLTIEAAEDDKAALRISYHPITGPVPPALL